LGWNAEVVYFFNVVFNPWINRGVVLDIPHEIAILRVILRA
jgi:hypothetical protein